MVASRAVFRCTECKATRRGSAGDEHKRSCERCGGQLMKVKFGPQRKRRR